MPKQARILIVHCKPSRRLEKRLAWRLIRQRLFPTEWQTANVQSQLGETLAAEQRFAEAEPVLLAGFAGLKAQAAKIPATSFASVGHTGECVAHLYRAWGKLDKAEAWRRKLAAEDKAQ